MPTKLWWQNRSDEERESFKIVVLTIITALAASLAVTVVSNIPGIKTSRFIPAAVIAAFVSSRKD